MPRAFYPKCLIAPEEANACRAEDKIAALFEGSRSKGARQGTRLTGHIATEVDRLIGERDNPTIAVADPRILA
jgi:hypothetical protein